MELKRLFVNDDFLGAKFWFKRCKEFLKNCYDEKFHTYVAYSYLRMTVYVNECFIKFSNDPQRTELLNKSMVALVSCVSEFSGPIAIFTRTKDKKMKTLISLIGEVLLDT